MLESRRMWLLVNGGSGGNNDEAVAQLRQGCAGAGFAIERVLSFPEQPLPAARDLDQQGIGLVAVFAGDGTVNALITGLAGWGGAVLVLPGGTMNLLYHRLNGERAVDEVIARAAAGRVELVRPKVIGCAGGTALADLLAGPGTRWYDVREALRDSDLVGVAGNAATAISETLSAPAIACVDPPLGRAEGYPLVMLTPTDGGIRVSGFCAETPADLLESGWALLRRRFREGPHDDLGLLEQISLASTDGAPFGILLDGEKADSPPQAEFRLVACGVDLLATQADGR